jgi:hypothetical protein
MSKLRFDPSTYQFYYRCRPEDGTRAKAAGFSWDPIRRRYYTEDPNVAVGLAIFGDNYVMDLLADALGAVTLPQYTVGAVGISRMPILSHAIH